MEKMGKVMQQVTKGLAGLTDGKRISQITKKLLN